MYFGHGRRRVADGDPSIATPVERIWDDVVSRKLYLTGAIGARHDGEAFGDAYELPNRTAYGETCASIANVYWNQRLFLRPATRKYVDVLERTLYNAALAGVSLAGDTFFYPNPLESDGRYAFNQGALTRTPWFDSSCCPTNVARFIPSVPDYIYAVSGATRCSSICSSPARRARPGGGDGGAHQKTAYPWNGHVELRLAPSRARRLRAARAHPGLGARAAGARRTVPLRRRPGGHALAARQRPAVPRGSTAATPSLTRTWHPGDVVALDLPMPVRRVTADGR